MDDAAHWRRIERDGLKWRPYCSCGWKGRASTNTDLAAAQHSTHMAKLSKPNRAADATKPHAARKDNSNG